MATPKRLALWVIKLMVSTTLIVVLIRRIDWNQVWTQIHFFDFYWLAAVFFIRILQFPISTLKWQQCLIVHDLHFKFGYLLKVICIGFFFNNFLPSTIGGDGYRIVKTIPQDGYRSSALSAVLLDRLVGSAVLLGLGLLCSLTVYHDSRSMVFRTFNLVGVAGIALSLVFFLAARAQGSRLAVLKEKLVNRPKLKPLMVNAAYITAHRGRLVNVVWISLGFHMVAFLSIKLLFHSLDLDISLLDCAIVVALTGFVALIPISINGIGLMEGSFVFLSSQIGLPVHESILAIFIYRIMTLLYSAGCGLIYLFAKVKHGRAV